jgi:acyl-coenzyme A synthetase/AMP-(fatty) acid ligase
MLAEYQRLEATLLSFLESGVGNFDDLALDVHRFQRRWNAPYANFCATQPEPRNWREIPAVPQSAFKQFALSVAAPEQCARTFHTSGTTGEGFGRHAFLTTRLYDAAVRAGWRRLGLPRLPHFILAPRPDDAPHSSLAHMLGALDALAAGTSWLVEKDGRLRTDAIATLEAVERRGEPVALLGTALAFLHLFETLGSRRIRLPAGSFAMETGGFKGSGREIAKPELYAGFRDFLDLAPGDVLNEYGMTELSSQFYTRGLGQPHAGPPWMRAVVFDPETGAEVAPGATGVLRIFDLANLGSVIALETQDLAIRHEHGAFELLGRDPGALPRGCSRQADELLQRR